ncbi:hypothetical protein N7468_009136 [Penicillium chermesinum]|uniref:Uncharacterized protein n=1 Tax=Penicillium chermesinum TaxID=63820 RepID=A0A9W9TEK1_9EURO|nr:uncharacterized protein N7468_009136 [Penicillium chermesinum]KAJ5219932.1 hypothetical protein N7468_009136 [Penicillium chermesinum]KAJ6157391.1 hypothetical protein N7470_004983 [Penicillium chermesinum]
MAAAEATDGQVTRGRSVAFHKNQPVHGNKNSPEYDMEQCVAAMKGKEIPNDLSSFWHRRAVIRGIRDSLEFAQSPAVIELCARDDSHAHQFARARNARLIMSDIIPDMDDSATQPYCIWYPELASIKTYREIACRFPSMRYQVGRACAAASYTDLYRELDLLPDVSIAEEAREVDTNAEIYKMIKSASQRYAVMDDFTRSVNLESPQTPAFLNGNMKPRWALEQRACPPKNIPDTTADDIDLEEDGFIGLEDVNLKDCDAFIGPGDSGQLWMPLPPDLPVLEKRLQTQMAAWDGNIDRYARLMHPRRLRTFTELNCILRGIHHSTMFAGWWAYQMEINPERAIIPDKLVSDGNKHESRMIRTAITARKIMSNEVGGIEDGSDCLPWMIWWPVMPHYSTCYELAKKCPSMRLQVAITCVLGDYEAIFRQLEPPPREALFAAAKRSSNPFYLQYLEESAAKTNVESEKLADFGDYDVNEASLAADMEPRHSTAYSSIDFSSMAAGWAEDFSIYGSRPANVGCVERYVWLSTATAEKIEDECGGVYESSNSDYVHLDPNDERLNTVQPILPMR